MSKLQETFKFNQKFFDRHRPLKLKVVFPAELTSSIPQAHADKVTVLYVTVHLNLRSLLTHKNVEFKWQSEQQAAFDRLKELITSTSALAYFDVNSKTRIVADASPVGLGAVLTQLQGLE